MKRMKLEAIITILYLLICVGSLAESLEEMKLRAKQGDAIAQLNLGMMYSRGLGVSENLSEVITWLRLAVGQGNLEAKTELDRISVKSVNVFTKPISGTIPTGDATLIIQTNPPDVSFSVFSGYSFVFSGMTPFRIENLRSGEYNICFEKPGYDLFWRVTQIDSRTLPLNVTLRQIDPQGSIPSCVEANVQYRSQEAYDAEEKAAKAKREADRAKQEAEKQEELRRMLDTTGLTCKEIYERAVSLPKGSRERRLMDEKYFRSCAFR